MKNIILTKTKISLINIELLSWYEKYYNNFSRPTFGTIYQKLIDDRIDGEPVHSLMRYTGYSGKFPVMFEDVKVANKVYGYINGKLDRYWIYDRSGNLLKTDEPKQTKLIRDMEKPLIDKTININSLSVSLNETHMSYTKHTGMCEIRFPGNRIIQIHITKIPEFVNAADDLATLFNYISTNHVEEKK